VTDSDGEIAAIAVNYPLQVTTPFLGLLQPAGSRCAHHRHRLGNFSAAHRD
jgi:hypothetical protein